MPVPTTDGACQPSRALRPQRIAVSIVPTGSPNVAGRGDGARGARRGGRHRLPGGGPVGVGHRRGDVVDLLRVRDVTVVGTARLSAGEVESLVAGLRDDHILRVDLEFYRRRLLDSPWVADVQLTRLLPATIQIAVVERTPMAVARHGQQLYLVDETGSIIDDYGPQYQEFDLPVVDGLMSAPKSGTPGASVDRVRLTASLLAGLGTRPDLRDRVSQIDVSNPRDAVVMFDDDPAWLHVGDRRFVERLAAVRRVAAGAGRAVWAVGLRGLAVRRARISFAASRAPVCDDRVEMTVRPRME